MAPMARNRPSRSPPLTFRVAAREPTAGPFATGKSEAGVVADADQHPNGQPPEDEYEDDEIVTVEATGKTVEEAVQKALDELGLEEDEVDVEILSEGSKGVLGLGSEEARVRVTSLPYEDEEYGEYEQGPEEEYEDELEIAPPGNRRFEPEPAGVARRVPPVYEEAPRVRRLDPEAEPFADLARQTLADLLERMDMPAEISLDAAEIDEDTSPAAGEGAPTRSRPR